MTTARQIWVKKNWEQVPAKWINILPNNTWSDVFENVCQNVLGCPDESSLGHYNHQPFSITFRTLTGNLETAYCFTKTNPYDSIGRGLEPISVGLRAGVTGCCEHLIHSSDACVMSSTKHRQHGRFDSKSMIGHLTCGHESFCPRCADQVIKLGMTQLSDLLISVKTF